MKLIFMFITRDCDHTNEKSPIIINALEMNMAAKQMNKVWLFITEKNTQVEDYFSCFYLPQIAIILIEQSSIVINELVYLVYLLFVC